MINIPGSTDINFQAFIVGFFLPFIASVGGYIIGLIRKMIEMINGDHL